MSDQELWNTLKNVQKTLKKWEHVKSRLPKAIREDAGEALYTELVEAADNLQSCIADALSHEIRADAQDAPPFNREELTEKLHTTAHKFIQANRMDFAKEILEAEAQLKGFDVVGTQRDSLDTAIDALVAYASGQKTAATVKPSMWNKIVAKIPGVCRFNSMSVHRLQEALKRAIQIQKEIKAAEAAGDKSKVSHLVREAMDLAYPETAKGLGAEINWKMYKKSYAKFVKAGKAVLELRKQNKKVEGLKAACDSKGKKKKKGCTSCSNSITTEQVQVMAKLVELGEEQAAKDLGTQLIAQQQSQDLPNPDTSSETIDHKTAFEAALEEGKKVGQRKEASGVQKLKMMLDDVIYGNRFQHELSRWTDANFDESKARELQEALSDSIENLLWTYMR